jgi:glutamate synthase domain-containing protein 2
LDPADKSVRAANYLLNLQQELLQLAHACGVAHPGDVRGDMIELLVGDGQTETVWDRFGYRSDWFASAS